LSFLKLHLSASSAAITLRPQQRQTDDPARKNPARFPARAQFASFNFTNPLICNIESRRRSWDGGLVKIAKMVNCGASTVQPVKAEERRTVGTPKPALRICLPSSVHCCFNRF
jgi:hypothetical protein